MPILFRSHLNTFVVYRKGEGNKEESTQLVFSPKKNSPIFRFSQTMFPIKKQELLERISNFLCDSSGILDSFRWGKVLKNGRSKICGRQPLKKLKWYGLPADHITSNFLKTAFHKFYLVYSWILCRRYSCSSKPTHNHLFVSFHMVM